VPARIYEEAARRATTVPQPPGAGK